MNCWAQHSKDGPQSCCLQDWESQTLEITEGQDRSTKCEGDSDTQGTPGITSNPASLSFGFMEEHELQNGSSQGWFRATLINPAQATGNELCWQREF